MLEPQVDLTHRALELGRASRARVAGVDQHDPRAGGDRPRVAVRDAGPRQRQPQPPQSGQHALAPSELALRVVIRRRTILTARRLAQPRWPRRPRSPSATSRRCARTTSTRRWRCWAPGGRRAVRRPAGADRARRRPRSTSPSCSPRSPTSASRSSTRPRLAAASRCAGGPRGTFAGPGAFQGFAPNGARIEIEGCDVLTVADELIQRNDAYFDSGDVARQLGFLPPAGSRGRGAADPARQPADPAGRARARRAEPSGSPTASGSCAAASRRRR